VSRPALPDRADVVVIGAGISGLVTARHLTAAGVDVAVVEARDRVGGRLKRVVTPSGRRLEAGGELVGEHMRSIRALADELGVPIVPMGVGEGQLVRFFEGERLLEAYPYEKAPESAAALHVATTALDELALQVPIEDPWNARGRASGTPRRSWRGSRPTCPTPVRGPAWPRSSISWAVRSRSSRCCSACGRSTRWACGRPGRRAPPIASWAARPSS